MQSIVIIILSCALFYTFLYARGINRRLKHLEHLVHSDIWAASQRRMGTSIHDSKAKGR